MYFRMMHTIKEVENQVSILDQKLNHIQRVLEQLTIRQRGQREPSYNNNMMKNFIDTVIVIVVVFFVQYIMRIGYRNDTNPKDTW